MDLGLLIVRAVVGLLLVGHGTQKLYGWWGGHGIDATAAAFHQLGHRPGRTMALLAGGSEALGGGLLFLGLLTPLGAAIVVGVMVVAMSVHVGNGLWATGGGYELPFTYAVVAAGLGFTGPGAVSVDSAAGLTGLHGYLWGAAAAALGIIAALLALARRDTELRRDAAPPAAAANATEAIYPVEEPAAGARSRTQG